MDYKDATILPEDKEQEHLSFVQKQILTHPVVKVHHGKWKELIEWENGNQFSIWDDTASSMMPVQLKRRKKKVVINLLKPLAEAIEGKLNFTAQFEGIPNSSELRDINGAQVATKLIAHNDYLNDVDALNEDLKYDLIRTGNAFRKWTWETGRFGYVENTKGEKTKEDGELVGCVPSVFNIRLDPAARGVEDARWIIEIAEVTEEAVCETFGITAEDIRVAQSDPSGKVGSGVDGLKYKGMNEKEAEKDRDEPTHIVAWYWERTSPAYPEGRHIISIPGTILWAKQNPALGKLPFFKYGYKRYGSSPWFTGPLHHVQDIQRDFNRMISIISEHVEGWRAKMVMDKNQGLKEGAFTTDSFEILEVDMSKGPPIPVNMPVLSPEVMNHRDFLIGAKDLVSNVHEVSYSQLPERASRAPASLYAMMVEQENQKIDPMIRRHNRTLKREVQFRLEMMGRYYKNPRMVKIIGVNERSTIAYFSGSKMEGNYDVKLVVGVSIHQSKTIQQRMMLDLKQAGAPIEWNTIFKLLWEGDISEKIRGDIADEQRASRENQCFLEGTYKKDFKDGGVLILIWDNHAVHLDMHTKLAKTEEAQRWDDETSAAMNAHILQHMGMLKQMMQRAAAESATTQAAAAGAGGGQAGAGGGGGGQATDETQSVEDSLPF
jgi:hypothetical protein